MIFYGEYAIDHLKSELYEKLKTQGHCTHESSNIFGDRDWIPFWTHLWHSTQDIHNIYINDALFSVKEGSQRQYPNTGYSIRCSFRCELCLFKSSKWSENNIAWDNLRKWSRWKSFFDWVKEDIYFHKASLVRYLHKLWWGPNDALN